MERDITNIKRIVIKVGSSSLCDDDGIINREKILKIILQIVQLEEMGYTVILVSSGAVAAGMGSLGMKQRPATMPKKQALAAIGQAHLMQIYEELFQIFKRRCAQVLLNHDDFDYRPRLLNLYHTINALLEYNVIPIINENDALAVDEIKLGDNDTLAALMVPAVEAELLILVSDIDGLYTANPRTDPDAQLISYVKKVDQKIMSYAGDAGTRFGTGGMMTKLNAAKMVNAYGSAMCIVNGNKENAIVNALKGEGTWFSGKSGRNLKARQHWLAYRAKSRGALIVDEGCKRALLERHTSLLPKGILEVTGRFQQGQVVDIVDGASVMLGRGIVNYGSDEIKLIKGLNTSEIEHVLHYKDYDEVIHANNIIINEDTRHDYQKGV